ncbi:NlpC/P60 family protein [Arcticibacter tournemirensis]|uniref:Hydrolase Nlp/P60 n=1 Tax=Arcticibacter tournemirensis TaxID=699437 RepID=A0A4Q0MAX2_9SPHI|nr:C40 family peptidase [Arcticibacter tournemirensis]KAA8484996.1 NlpC/P60 family protein [Arcticibacter tournemirensis]RXF70428.1 hydrolase Nlp/P60 [Arcticibacter tournemirensis]TQM50553.1 NlpC/P60 family protein [Arcticibacter tournemirensis]
MTDSQFGVCHLSLVPVRAESSDKSEITSYVLFGDCFEVLERAGNWALILTAFDKYAGWIDIKQYISISAEQYETYSERSRILGCAVYQPLMKVATSELLYLLAGSSIPPLNENSFYLNTEEYRFVTLPLFAVKDHFAEHVASYARFFLQAPYLWGGKSLFGIDCSGFTQMVFKMLGITLKRDAWQQAEQGKAVNFLQESKAGDLAFFDNDEGRIIHVGIMLGENEIIHASGHVKIDSIDDQGIYSSDLQRHTHKLRIIKRFI